jgi:RecA/RadA recombinase
VEEFASLLRELEDEVIAQEISLVIVDSVAAMMRKLHLTGEDLQTYLLSTVYSTILHCYTTLLYYI